MEKQKVTISKELAEKIEKLREIYVTDSKIV